MNPRIFDYYERGTASWRWPNPLDAPDVPPSEYLTAYKLGRLHLHELVKQIEQSENCQRALARLEIEYPEDEATGFSISSIEEGVRDREADVRFGGIWTSRCLVEAFDGRIVNRYLWKSVSALIIGELIHTRNDAVVRVVPVSEKDDWPENATTSTDFLFITEGGAEYVAHLEFQHEMSVEQLFRRWDNVEMSCRSDLQERIVRSQSELPSLDRIPHENVARYRAQIEDLARGLSATATARRAALEAIASPSEEWKPENLITEFNLFSSEELAWGLLDDIETGIAGMAAAGGGDTFTKAYLCPGSLHDLLQQLKGGYCPQGVIGFCAKVEDFPSSGGGRWIFEKAPRLGLRQNAPFLLVDRKRKKALGAGVVGANERLHFGCGDQTEIDASQEADWLMLFPLR